MKGDFSRSTFDPAKHFSGVRMQQGRVQLDADWNENLDILRRRIESETIDVIGECGIPVHDAGFGVVTAFGSLPADDQAWLAAHGLNTLAAGDFYLTRGRAYVDGIQIENDHSLPLSRQPFILPLGSGLSGGAGIYLLYLDVWERHITAIEDPSIREVALGGPDTATRSQVVWQARAARVGDLGASISCDNAPIPWPGPSTGRMAAHTQPADVPEDPCIVPPGSGYKRLENQLYRVEIHKGSGEAGGPSFKWSRDNGSVVVSIAEFSVDGAGAKIRTTSLGRDDVLGLHENDWIEVIDDAAELALKPGMLTRIVKIDPGNILTLADPVSGYDINGHPKVRRWDSAGEVAIPVPDTTYIPLEGGVEVKFDAAGTFRSGDYWMIPARTVPGQYGGIQWPVDGTDPAFLLPFGILHHYCKLALLTGPGSDAAGGTIALLEDCRKIFPPLTELPTGGDRCCSVTAGPGGDYPDVQSALAARPAGSDWWTVCLTPGSLPLTDTIMVDGAQNLAFGGCGGNSRLIGPSGKPVFIFTGGQNITIEGLRIEASSPSGAILFSGTRAITIAGNVAANVRMAPPVLDEAIAPSGIPTTPVGPLIVMDAVIQAEIRDNDLAGLPAVRANGRMIDVLRNRITGGGVQIVPPSTDVLIDGNQIIRGAGAGIQLGGGDKTAADYAAMYYPAPAPAGTPSTIGPAPSPAGVSGAGPSAAVGIDSSPVSSGPMYPSGIRRAAISRNLIGSMTGSGIITESSFLDPAKLGDVEDLTIDANQIVGCCRSPDVILSAVGGVGGGIAAIGLFGARIAGNFIAGNGTNAAACGIFILDGGDLEIAGNVVAENGSADTPDAPAAYQAGIAVLYAAANPPGGQALYPAARIHDNRVVCPSGQALTVTATGNVTVDGNVFASRGRRKQPADPLNFGEKGACVYIFDLGTPVWQADIALLLQMMAGGPTNLHLADSGAAAAAGPLLPDGRVLFHNNQITFDTEVEETVSSLGAMDAQWMQRAWDAAFFSVLILSLDDISLSLNQFQATVPPYMQTGIQKNQAGNMPPGDLLAYFLKFIPVGTAGTIIRATGNGLAERALSNYVSYASNAGAMNATTGNEATHAFVTNGPKKAEASNLSLTV